MTTAIAVIGAVGWLALTFGAAALGARFLPDEWYRQLNKPTWNPPDAIFAPVWALLYLLMAASAWLAWIPTQTAPPNASPPPYPLGTCLSIAVH
jgi:tryptophan-rich sensory protein